MYKIVIGLVIVFAILLGGFILVKTYIGDIWPAVVPSTSTNASTETVQEAETLNSAVEVIPFDIKGLPFDLKSELGDKYTVGIFASEIGKVRDLTFSPEGVLLASVPGEGRVIALLVGGDGSVSKKIVVDELNGPHGIAFHNGKLFIAEDNRMGRYAWNAQNLSAVFDKELFKLPSGGHDAHTIVFGKDGALYVKVGSVCNVCKETDLWRATVIKSDADGNNPQVFAKGLRNAAFLAIHPESGELWGTENGRDMLGDNLPQEEINIIREGKDYGWPNCYGDKVLDISFYKGTDRTICANTETAAVYMQAHSAPLGLQFIPENFSSELKGDLLVAFHGSWNRSEPTGYKVVRLDVDANGIVTKQTDFLTGFITGSTAAGRPVDVEFDRAGNLFISDDKYGAVYVISPKK